MRIGIAGVTGRMGRLLVPAVQSVATLVGGIGRGSEPPGVALFGDIQSLSVECDAVIDFTAASTVPAHAKALADAHVAWILGTTGLDEAGQRAVRVASADIAIVQAANFSAGMTLVLALAERLGAALPGDMYDAEILEMHHRDKRDAPSGTALALGAAVATGRGGRLPLPRADRNGTRTRDEIGFASLRGGLVVGEHTLSFTGNGEQITVGHRALDRSVFAHGAVQAALWVQQRLAGLYTMRDVIGDEGLALSALAGVKQSPGLP